LLQIASGGAREGKFGREVGSIRPPGFIFRFFKVEGVAYCSFYMAAKVKQNQSGGMI
jgi:hypothetical protein